jgi:hypothetical protein
MSAMPRSHVIAAILAVLFTGCTTPTTPRPATHLVIRDQSGAVIATGELHLPKTLPANGQVFDGQWRLISSTDAFPAGATKGGTYRGSVSDGNISIDLNAGTADNNVILTSAKADAGQKGQWYHSTFVGRRAMGSFSLTESADQKP